MPKCKARDFYELPSSREYTTQGFMRAPAKIARAGVQVYSRREIGLDGGDAPIRLYRPPEEVAKSARSFESAPMADEHPAGDVTATNWKLLAVGDVRDVSMDGDFLGACVIVRDDDAIALVRSGKAELSCGYSFVLDQTPGKTAAGEEYDAVQREIEGNHVAIVDRGRAGPQVRIADRDKEKTMPKMHRIAVADVKLTDKLLVPGFAIDVELDEAAARSVQDKFDLHSHGMGACKDAYGQLQKSYDTLNKHAETLQDRLAEIGDDDDEDEDDDDLMEQDDAAFGAEKEEPKETTGKKKAGDKKTVERRPGFLADGRPGFKLRLRRALDEVVALRKLTAQDALEKLAEERQVVIDAAKPLLADDFAFKGKSIHDVRLAVIDVAREDEAMKEIVKIQIGDVELPKLKADIAKKAFATIIAMRGTRSSASDDDGQDKDLSRALAGSSGADGAGGVGGEGGGGESSSRFGRGSWIARSATDSRRVGGDSDEAR